jgi:hypothetical protein
MCESGCLSLATLSDPQELETKLKPYESVVNQVQAVFLLKNPVGFAIPFLSVNFLFFVIYKLNLSFLPTFFLLLTLRTLLSLAILSFPDVFKSIFDKPIENPEQGPFKLEPLPELCILISGVCALVQAEKKALTPQGNSLAGASLLLLVLGALFFLFLVTGTFWVNFVIVNLAFFVPMVVLHPAVKPTVAKLLAVERKEKAE